MLQFYPTPAALAARCWAKFNQRNVRRLLEPSAGRGDLIPPGLFEKRYSGREIEIDCVEIDITHHPTLREHGFHVIGQDFMDMTAEQGYAYSHIVMNPPFRYGADHLLHAWEILYEGEIVAILNAETVENPFSEQRKYLARLINEHGDVEYAEMAFGADSDAQRTTDVRIAIVHLTKQGPPVSEVVGDLLGDLKRRGDAFRGDRHALDGEGEIYGEMALQGVTRGEIESLVLVAKAATEARIDEVRAKHRAMHYTGMLGLSPEALVAAGLRTSLQECADEAAQKQASRAAQQTRQTEFRSALASDIAEAAAEVNKAAWTSLFNRQSVTSKVSSQVAKSLSTQMDEFAQMQFNERNIDLFIGGLLDSAGSITDQMMLDVFFGLMTYHTGNAVFYRGWKSNDVHRIGMRLRKRRLILPRLASYGSIDCSSLTFLSDVDKVFCMLDSMIWEPGRDGSLESMARDTRHHPNGTRLHGTYFDLRYYAGTNTGHVFPRREDLVDRLNRVVGRLRQWLPPVDDAIGDDFWEAYDLAEKFSDQCVADAIRDMPVGADNAWRLLRRAEGKKPHLYDDEQEMLDRLEARLSIAITEQVRAEGIDLDRAIEGSSGPIDDQRSDLLTLPSPADLLGVDGFGAAGFSDAIQDAA